ncbi:MAG: hypothetical protein JXR73_14265 [Candidatus Omnitrophica bacterium]|nr:hypothetical protein [Candidatus Omnitrophota bacterium]
MIDMKFFEPYMNMENAVIALGVLAAVFFLGCLILLVMNMVQRKRKRDIQQALRSRLQSSYNQFYQISLAAERIREFNMSSPNVQDKIPMAMNQASYIVGTSNAARSDIISYCREQLRFVPVWEDPNEPFKGKLPKAKKTRKIKNNGPAPLSSIPEKPKANQDVPPPPKLNL